MNGTSQVNSGVAYSADFGNFSIADLLHTATTRNGMTRLPRDSNELQILVKQIGDVHASIRPLSNHTATSVRIVGMDHETGLCRVFMDAHGLSGSSFHVQLPPLNPSEFRRLKDQIALHTDYAEGTAYPLSDNGAPNLQEGRSASSHAPWNRSL